MIHLLMGKPTDAQVQNMLAVYSDYIKLAVDVRLGILAGGGAMHADCEAVLLEDGSKQEDVWGADWYPFDKEVAFTSLINIRPAQGNTRTRVQDPELRQRIEVVVRKIFEGR